MAYDLIETPLGPLFAACTARGLFDLRFDPDPDRHVGELEARTGGQVMLYREELLDTRHQLDEYFSARRRVFELPLDLSAAEGFTRRVLDELLRIPFGEVRSYGEVARALGNPQAARAVGRAVHVNPIAIVVPCHRVVGSDGSLTGYAGGLDRKTQLLSLEAR